MVPADVVLGPVPVAVLGALGVAGVVVVTGFARAWFVVELLVTSAALAALVRRLATPLARVVPRGVAVALVTVGALVALLAIGVAGYHDLTDQTAGLAEVVRAQVQRLDPASALGKAAARGDVARRAEEQIRGLPSRLVLGGGGLSAGVRSGSSVIVTLVLTLFWVGGGPRLRRAALDRMDDTERRERLRRVTATAYRHGAGYVLRTLGVAVVAGALVGAAAQVAGVPGALVLGVWAGLWTVVPALGPLVGGAPVVALALVLGRGPWRVAALVLFLVLLAAATRFVRRLAVERATVAVGPLLTLVALTLGLQLAGVVGGLVLLVGVAVLAAGGAELARVADEAPWDALAPSDDDVDPWYPARVRLRLRPRAGTEGDELAIGLPLRSLAWVVAGLLALAAIWRLVHAVPVVFVWFVIAIVLSLALHRVVGWLAARLHLPHTAAVAGVVLVALAALGTLVVLAGPPAVATFRGLPERLPRVLRDLQDLPVVGRVLERNDAAANVERYLADAPDRFLGDADTVRRFGVSLGDSLVAVWSIVALTVAALLDGPRLARGMAAAVPPRQRRPLRRLGTILYDVVGRYAAGSATVALLNGTVVTVLGLVAGVPMAPVLGVWAALWNFVPQVGGFVGALPLVSFALMESTVAGLVCLGGFLVYQNLENHLIQPAIVGKAVDVSPLATLAAVLLGGALAGFPGALLATPLVGAVKLAYEQARGSR